MSLASDHVNLMRNIAQQAMPNTALEGTVIPDSYNAQVGTVDVLLGESAGVTEEVDGDESPTIIKDVPLAVPSYGFQHGPRGGERVTCFLVPDGAWRAYLDYDEDDSPQAPAGETWHVHFTNGLADLTPNAFWKLTNDGQTAGDGKGGFRAGGTAYASLVAPLVEVGTEGLDPDLDAVVTVRYLRQYVQQMVQAVFNGHTHPGVQLGGSNTPPPTAQIDFEPQGSQTVKAAP